MHLIPSFVLVGVLALAWRWEWIGAALYGAAGMIYGVAAPELDSHDLGAGVCDRGPVPGELADARGAAGGAMTGARQAAPLEGSSRPSGGGR
jgi:hypothetical protein